MRALGLIYIFKIPIVCIMQYSLVYYMLTVLATFSRVTIGQYIATSRQKYMTFSTTVRLVSLLVSTQKRDAQGYVVLHGHSRRFRLPRPIKSMLSSTD